MNADFLSARTRTLHRRLLFRIVCLAAMVVATARAQTTVQDLGATPVPDATTTPVATVAPVASPAPAPNISPVISSTTITDGITDLTSYTQARTPTASVVLTSSSVASGLLAQPASTSSAGGLQPATASNAPTTATQPNAVGGVFSVVNLGPPPTNTLPPSASVILQFDASRAGTLVWVQTLDGGTLKAQDADGQMIIAPGGFWMEISAQGQISFSFQAPSASARYQVLVRLDNVSTFLPFVVPEPAHGH